jgi:hypothetical protein
MVLGGLKGGFRKAYLVATIIVFFFYVPGVSFFSPCLLSPRLRGGFRLLFFLWSYLTMLYLAVCMACPFVSPHFTADQSLRGVS